MYVAPCRCPCVLWTCTVETPAGATYKESKRSPNVLVLSVCLSFPGRIRVSVVKLLMIFMWSETATPKVGLIRLVLPAYGTNTDTCAHILLNHKFINTLRTPTCVDPQRVIFRNYNRYISVWSTK